MGNRRKAASGRSHELSERLQHLEDSQEQVEKGGNMVAGLVDGGYGGGGIIVEDDAIDTDDYAVHLRNTRMESLRNNAAYAQRFGIPDFVEDQEKNGVRNPAELADRL